MSIKQICAGHINDFPEGTMKEVKTDDRTILITNVDGELRALGSHCIHLGAPLAQGVLSGGRIVCPWHHACFCSGSGKSLNPPGHDGIPTYVVTIQGTDVMVHYSDDDSGKSQLPPFKRPDYEADSRTFVVIGSGAGAAAAVEELRQHVQARIKVISKDTYLPYDRTSLSKGYLQKAEAGSISPIRSAEFYDEYGIEFILGTEVQSIDAERQQVRTDKGAYGFDSLLIATGGSPNVPGFVDGAPENVYLLRTPDDADAIIKELDKAQSAVVIGASFIAMEVASALRKHDLDVTVTAPEEIPFHSHFGSEIGNWLLKHAEDSGVTFRLGKRVSRVHADEGSPVVEFADSEPIKPDMVVIGTGIDLNTRFLHTECCDKNGAVQVDEFLRVNNLKPPVYAAGDIAAVPTPFNDAPLRVEHWRVAQQQGRVAARNMVGNTLPYKKVPFFWFNLFDLKTNYVGHADDWDDVIIDGDLDDAFIAYYICDKQIRAALGYNSNQQMCAFEECMRLECLPDAEAARDGSIDWRDVLQEHYAAEVVNAEAD